MNYHIPCKRLLDTRIGVGSSCANNWTRNNSSGNQRHCSSRASATHCLASILARRSPLVHHSVFDIFHEAQGAALSSRQIGEALAARTGLEPTTVMIEQMRQNAIGVVHRLTRSGTLIPTGRDGLGTTWAVA